MSTLYEEYARLKSLASTPEGMTQIEDAWMLASNHEKNDKGEWIKTRHSAGDNVTGMAIYTAPPYQYIVSKHPGGDHDRPYWELVNQMRISEKCSPQDIDLCEEDLEKQATLMEQQRILEGRIKKGWVMYSPEWKHPFVMISGAIFFKKPLLLALEKVILEQGIGLPLFIIHSEQHQ